MKKKTFYQSISTKRCFPFQQGIEQLKKEEASWVRKSRWKSIQSVFGRFSMAWFSPFSKPLLKTKSDINYYSVQEHLKQNYFHFNVDRIIFGYLKYKYLLITRHGRHGVVNDGYLFYCLYPFVLNNNCNGNVNIKTQQA